MNVKGRPRRLRPQNDELSRRPQLSDELRRQWQVVVVVLVLVLLLVLLLLLWTRPRTRPLFCDRCPRRSRLLCKRPLLQQRRRRHRH